MGQLSYQVRFWGIIMRIRILIAHEKHGDRYFNASTNYELAKVSIKLLKERLKLGYYTPDEDYKEPPKQLDETILAKLEDRTRKSEEYIYKEKVKYHQQYLESKRDYERIQQIVEQNDLSLIPASKYRESLPRAFYYLQEREGHEYENLELVELEEV